MLDSKSLAEGRPTGLFSVSFSVKEWMKGGAKHSSEVISSQMVPVFPGMGQE